MNSVDVRKRKYKPQWYKSPIDLPEAKSGSVSVRHRIVTGSTPIISLRQALMRGVRRPLSARLDEPLRVHELHEEKHGLWMTDLPEELNQIMEALHEHAPHGHVCVGGLGLGIMARLITDCLEVESVTVVERSQDVIDLCADTNYQTCCADIGTYLRDCPRFDGFFLDTWQGTNEGTWWDEVLPLRRIIRQRFGAKPLVHCWAEDIMLGQVMSAARRQGGLYWNYKVLPKEASENQIRFFVSAIGLPKWEKQYGAAIDTLAAAKEPPVAQEPAR